MINQAKPQVIVEEVTGTNVKTRRMAHNEIEEKKDVESALLQNNPIKKAPTGCPLKCGIRDLPAEKESLINHFLNFCNRMPIKCQLCDAVFWILRKP